MSFHPELFLPFSYRYNAYLDLINFKRKLPFNDDDMEDDPNTHQNVVADKIDKVSVLKDEPTVYFSDKAYIVRCHSRQKATP